jgi:hypothetical protein
MNSRRIFLSLSVSCFLIPFRNFDTKINHVYVASTEWHFSLFKLFLTYSEIGGRTIGIVKLQQLSCSGSLQVAVRKVPQEDLAFHGYYKALQSTFREAAVKPSERFDARCNSEDV